MNGNDEGVIPGNLFRRTLMAAAVCALPVACGGDLDGADDEATGAPAEQLAAGENGAHDDAVYSAIRAVPAGTRLVFEVLEEVSTSSHDAGDTFTLRLAEPVGGTSGLTVEEGTQARATVTVAEPSGGPDQEAILVFQVESLRIEGRNRALNGEVEAAETDAGRGDSGARSAAKVATGAAAGALVGQILGRDTRSTVQGAAAGAVAGLGVALTTRDGHAVLPRGSLVTVRLEDSLVVN